MKFLNALENLILKLLSENRAVVILGTYSKFYRHFMRSILFFILFIILLLIPLGDFNIVHNTIDSSARLFEEEERKRLAEKEKQLQEQLQENVIISWN